MKRLLSVCLSVVILAGMLAVGVSAATVLTTSDEAIRILKAEEGFSSKPYWDYAQWTVGYGTACPEDKRAHYTKNGITEEEAEDLLGVHVAKYEAELYKFINKTGVQLNQNQFDALVLFSYNCGSGWTYNANGSLYKAIVSGAKGNTLVDAFSRWCNAGGQIKTFLLRRRLCEANIYLNGVYSQSAPDNFGYVLYDACGGVSNPNVQGFDTELTAAMIPVPTYNGYRFKGWYTQRVGGTKVTVLDAKVKNSRLYAHWVDAEGNDPSQSTDGVTVTVTANNVNVRQGPGTNYTASGFANTGDQLVITQTATGSGYTWGKFQSGWICLKYTNYDTVSTPEKEEPQNPTTRTGTIRVSDCLRVRSGPSTGYSVVGYLDNGAKVEILEEKIAGSMVWGKIAKGWISLDYVVFDTANQQTQKPSEPETTKPTVTTPTEPSKTPEKNEEPVSQTWKGTVKVSDFLRVRSGPSTQTSVVGYLYPNEKVTITEKTTSGSMTWGKISKGWISLDYIVLEKTNSDNASQQKLTGKVKVNDLLRVRSGPGTSYAIAGFLSPDAKVEITEQKTVGSTVWGKMSKGWISLDYVVLDKQTNGTPATQKVTKTVTADCLRIRSAAGTSNSVVGYLYAGAKVEVLETVTVSGTKWGRTAKGWISLDYVK